MDSEARGREGTDEIERIRRFGPLGRWRSVASSFPLGHEEMVFRPDGGAEWTSESGMSARETIGCVWRMAGEGRLVITDAEAHAEGRSGAAVDFAITRRQTEFGPRLVLTSADRDTFWHCLSALERVDPPVPDRRPGGR